MRSIGIIIFFFLFIQEAFAFIPYATVEAPKPKNARSFMSIFSHPQKRLHPTEQVVGIPGQVVRIPQPYLAVRNVFLPRVLPPVHSIYVKGGIDLQIITGPRTCKVSMREFYQGITIHVSGDVVYIQNDKPVNQSIRPVVRLQLESLRELVVAGDSCVKAANVCSPCGLVINTCGCGQICLTGPVNLIRVVNTGNGLICIPHVRSCHLQVLATRYGCTKLGGTARLLLVRAFQNATVDSRFMCSETALVQANDHALVTLKTTASLQAFAGGMSNVYFYIPPNQLLRHTSLSGNVFPMYPSCCY